NNEIGISAVGIVRDNVAEGNRSEGIFSTGTVTGNFAFSNGTGLVGDGTVSGNFVQGNKEVGLSVGEGSIATDNTARFNESVGISVACPSNLIGNTATDNPGGNLILNVQGCTNTNNLAP